MNKMNKEQALKILNGMRLIWEDNMEKHDYFKNKEWYDYQTEQNIKYNERLEMVIKFVEKEYK